MADKKRIYKIVFATQGEVYEIFAREVSQGALFGFVEVEEILFGERSQVVVDPSEERLKHEFDGVKRTYLPMHAILRIDEVEKQGTGTIRERDGNTGTVAAFPFPMMSPESQGPKS